MCFGDFQSPRILSSLLHKVIPISCVNNLVCCYIVRLFAYLFGCGMNLWRYLIVFPIMVYSSLID
jgi:hypothetical protein